MEAFSDISPTKQSTFNSCQQKDMASKKYDDLLGKPVVQFLTNPHSLPIPIPVSVDGVESPPFVEINISKSARKRQSQ